MDFRVYVLLSLTRINSVSSQVIQQLPKFFFLNWSYLCLLLCLHASYDHCKIT